MRVIKRIKLRSRVEFTRNLFGKPEELAGKWLDVLEENREGECLAIHRPANASPHLVSVDPRDIEDRMKTPSNEFITLNLALAFEEWLGRSFKS